MTLWAKIRIYCKMLLWMDLYRMLRAKRLARQAMRRIHKAQDSLEAMYYCIARLDRSEVIALFGGLEGRVDYLELIDCAHDRIGRALDEVRTYERKHNHE